MKPLGWLVFSLPVILGCVLCTTVRGRDRFIPAAFSVGCLTVLALLILSFTCAGHLPHYLGTHYGYLLLGVSIGFIVQIPALWIAIRRGNSRAFAVASWAVLMALYLVYSIFSVVGIMGAASGP